MILLILILKKVCLIRVFKISPVGRNDGVVSLFLACHLDEGEILSCSSSKISHHKKYMVRNDRCC